MADIFSPPAERRAAAQEAQQASAQMRREAIGLAFSSGPNAIAFLRASLKQANSAASYRPGMDFATAAYNEGRRAALREIVAAIDDAFPPPQA